MIPAFKLAFYLMLTIALYFSAVICAVYLENTLATIFAVIAMMLSFKITAALSADDENYTQTNNRHGKEKD